MLRFMDCTMATARQGRKTNSRFVADFGVWQLEPRVLLTASGSDLMEPLSDPAPTGVQEESSGGMVSFSMAWDEPIAAPSDLAVTALSSSELRLTWSDNSHNETGFGVWKWISGRFRMIATVGANVTEFVDAGLAASTTYLYQVHAFNDFMASPLSASASGTTLTVAPTGLSAVAVSSSEIELSWSGSPGATGYHVERSLDGVTGWMLVGMTDSFTWDMTDSGLDGGTTYHYRVKAANVGGLSDPSSVAAATTEPAPVTGVPAPMNLVASVFGHKHVRLTWSAVEVATSYVIERSDNGGEWMEIAVVEATELTEYKDHWVSLDGTYAYRVRAVSDGGMSVPSDEVVVTMGKPLVMMAKSIPGQSFSSNPILEFDDEEMGKGKGKNKT